MCTCTLGSTTLAHAEACEMSTCSQPPVQPQSTRRECNAWDIMRRHAAWTEPACWLYRTCLQAAGGCGGRAA